MLPAHINKPNFFILGAAKSGATSLYHHLKKHPDIFLTDIKEPTFFCEGFQVVQNPILYFELYDSASTETIRGEASHAYFSNPSSPKVLKGLFPDAKFVLILRNPAHRAFSLYHHMRKHGYEYINSFEAALQAEEFRSNSLKFIKHCPEHFYNYLYYRSGLYGKQLQRYFSFFPKQQFHIIKFEEFIADPAEHLGGIFDFLEVDRTYSHQLARHNSGKVTTRFPRLQYLTKTKLQKPSILQKLTLSALKHINMTTIPPLQKETQKMLLDRYSSDLELLYELTGISFQEE